MLTRMTTHTDTPTDPDATPLMLTPTQYAEAHTLSIRTVRRYLAAGKLPGARQLAGSNEWVIPVDARPLQAQPAAVAVREQPARPAVAPDTTPVTLAGQLAAQPAFLSLDDAARLLGVKPADIRRNRDAFDVPAWCGARSILVPQATVRRIAGLS